jgi:hypothetical protein
VPRLRNSFSDFEHTSDSSPPVSIIKILISLIGLSISDYLVVIGRGHNNDQGMFNLSDVESMLVDKKVSLLTDLGYARRATQIVRPISGEDADYSIAAQVFNKSQASERVKVEPP